MIFKRQILFPVFLLLAKFVIAQGGTTIKASVDKSKILIGEPLKLTIEAYLSPESVKNFISIDSIKHFEFVDKPIIDTTDKRGGWNIKGVYTLTSFDSGQWFIPSFLLSNDAKSDSIPIEVVFSDFDPNQEYHDIKDILEVKPSKEKMKWWWFLSCGVLFLALMLLYLSRKKKPVPIAVQKAVADPYEEAMLQLEQLQKEKIEVKQYYSRLIDIFRLYVFRKKNILSLQKTTDDIVVQLRSLTIDKDQFDKLAQILWLSDFVKFAKYIPSKEDERNSLDEIRNAITTIEKTGAKTPL